jgi:hypothetical protein
MVLLFWARLVSQAKLILAVVNSFLKVTLGQFRVGEAVLSTAVVRAELQIGDELYRDNFSRNEISRTFLVFFLHFLQWVKVKQNDWIKDCWCRKDFSPDQIKQDHNE